MVPMSRQQPRIRRVLADHAGRVLRPLPGKDTAEVHDYVDVEVSVLASSLTKRAGGYRTLGFPDPCRLLPQVSNPRV
jgi:superfamily II DNA or RNA helicase